KCCPRPRRIISNHPANRSARTRGNVRSKGKTFRFEKAIQLVQHHTGADANRALLPIKIRDEPVVSREIHDDAIANRTTNQTRSGAAWNYRNACLRGSLDDRAGLFRDARKRDSHRLNLIVRRVRGVELTSEIVEGDLTMRSGERGVLLSWRHSANA